MKSMAVSAVLLLSVLGCATQSLAQVSTAPVSASEFLRLQVNGKSRADRLHREKPIDVVGVVVAADVAAKQLDLGTTSPPIAVRCRLTLRAEGEPEAAGNRLASVGQLVIVRGIGHLSAQQTPELLDCSVVWRGAAPGSPSGDRRVTAIVAGRSATICSARAQPARASSARTRTLDSVIARSVADLRSMGRDAMQCTEPLVALVLRCRESVVHAQPVPDGPSLFAPVPPAPVATRGGVGPECSVQEVLEGIQEVLPHEVVAGD